MGLAEIVLFSHVKFLPIRVFTSFPVGTGKTEKGPWTGSSTILFDGWIKLSATFSLLTIFSIGNVEMDAPY